MRQRAFQIRLPKKNGLKKGNSGGRGMKHAVTGVKL